MVRVGDIVKTKSKDGKTILPSVVTKVNTCQRYGREELNNVEVLFADGTYGYRTAQKFTETGRHIEIQSVLASIK